MSESEASPFMSPDDAEKIIDVKIDLALKNVEVGLENIKAVLLYARQGPVLPLRAPGRT